MPTASIPHAGAGAGLQPSIRAGLRAVLRAVVPSGLALVACSHAVRPAAPPASNAEPEIRRALEQWPQDFNAGNAKAVCGLFAPDARLMYPGRPDRDFAAACAQLTAAVKAEPRPFRYDAPEIQEIVVSGDLAVARLVWTLHVAAPAPEGSVTIRENGIDVFRRQPDGAWRIYISHAYPDVAPPPEGGSEKRPF